jgi:subtilisin family serine protease
MNARRLALADLAGRTGESVRVAVIDSGIHGSHPHVAGVAASVAFDDHGRETTDVSDSLGHGTAVAAAIREKATACSLLSVKVFDRTLATTGAALVAAIRWAAAQRVHLINLSLGTSNPGHEAALADAVAEAAALGVTVAAAAPQDGVRWLPGALPGVIAVEPAWDCPRDECLVETRVGLPGFRVRASGYPRPIPGVSPERNLKGPSFAVANATGLLALLVEGRAESSVVALESYLRGDINYVI